MIKRIENTQDLADLIKMLNTAQGTKITALADLSQVNRENLYRIMRGNNPTLNSVLKILNALGCTLMATQSPAYYEHK